MSDRKLKIFDVIEKIEWIYRRHKPSFTQMKKIKEFLTGEHTKHVLKPVN